MLAVEVSAMKKLAQFALGLCVLTALAGLASAAPRATGKIAFVRSAHGPERIWVMSMNGMRQRALTPVTMSAETPELSRDGRRIVFSRLIATTATVQHDIYVVNVDGSGLRRLTFGARDETAPTWSPDGRRIAYERGDPGQIYVARADGTHEVRVAKGEYPAWSPDGRELAFTDGKRIIRLRLEGRHRRVVYAARYFRACRFLDWAR
jgi:TolB protein